MHVSHLKSSKERSRDSKLGMRLGKSSNDALENFGVSSSKMEL